MKKLPENEGKLGESRAGVRQSSNRCNATNGQNPDSASESGKIKTILYCVCPHCHSSLKVTKFKDSITGVVVL